MGVDMSVAIGVGLTVSQDEFDAYVKRTNPEEYYYGEVLYELVRDEPLLTYGAGGSEYDDKDLRYWISAKRLTEEYNYDTPGGVFGGDPDPSSMLTDYEKLALWRVADELDLENPRFISFLSIYWH